MIINKSKKRTKRRRSNHMVVRPLTFDEKARLFVLINSKLQPELGTQFMAEYKDFFVRFVDDDCSVKYASILFMHWKRKREVFELLGSFLCIELNYVKFPADLFPHIIKLFLRESSEPDTSIHASTMFFQIHYIFHNHLSSMGSRKALYMEKLLTVIAASRELDCSFSIEFMRLLITKIHPGSYDILTFELIERLNFIYEIKPELLENYMPGLLAGKTPMLLVNRIFGKYGIPLCALCYLVQWFRPRTQNLIERNLLTEIILGKSIRELTDNNIQITKKMVGFLTDYVPQRPLTLKMMFITAQLISRGISQKDAEVLSKINWFEIQPIYFFDIAPVLFTRLGNDFNRFQIAADFLGNLSADEKQQINIKTINIGTLFTLIENWTFNLNCPKHFSSLETKASGIAPMHFKSSDGEELCMLELRSSLDFYREGFLQKHCVLSYFRFAVKGNCHIFSLRKVSGDKPVLTIELRENQIIQVRGICNRLPNSEEETLVRSWADQNNIHYD